MTIENLVRVVPPPTVPSEPFQGRWEPIEVALGTALPSDYKDFARLYGSGDILDFVHVMTPRTADGGAGFARWVGEICRDWGHMERETSTVYWPNPGGLLPFGRSIDGDHFFWQTSGPLEAWRIATWDRGGFLGENVETFDCDLTDFLAGIATGNVTSAALPDDLLDCKEVFRPAWKSGHHDLQPRQG